MRDPQRVAGLRVPLRSSEQQTRAHPERMSGSMARTRWPRVLDGCTSKAGSKHLKRTRISPSDRCGASRRAMPSPVDASCAAIESQELRRILTRNSARDHTHIRTCFHTSRNLTKRRINPSSPTLQSSRILQYSNPALCDKGQL